MLRRDSKLTLEEVSTVDAQLKLLRREKNHFFFIFRSTCLCHVCSEIRDIYKKTGAWFYKGLPNYDLPARANGDLKADSRGEQAPKLTKTTKLGMEIESDEDEEDGGGENQKIVKNGSFSSTFLKSRNLFNLRLSTDFGSRLTFDSSTPLPKKSPVTPYSRQTSSSDSQKSANSLQPQTADWESTSPNSVLHRQRRNSISSCYSISETSAAALEKFTMNQSEFIAMFWDKMSNFKMSTERNVNGTKTWQAKRLKMFEKFH